MDTLRDYQITDSLNTRRELAKHLRVLLQGATGSGKTVEGTDFALKACEKGLRVAFLCDRMELIEQTANKFIKAGIDFQIIMADTESVQSHKAYICMVETFYRRASIGWFTDIKFDLFIFDEAHMGNYFKIMDMFPTVMSIGLTATPVASSKNHPLKKYYNKIVCGPSVSWLVERKYLVPAVEVGHNALLSLKVQNGEFTNESQAEQFSAHGIDRKMFTAWEKLASNRQTIIYCINVAHAKSILKKFKELNISAECVTAETPKEERRRILASYQKGFTQVLVNVGVLTKGYDSPQTSCIVLHMATSSTTKYYQIIGRGARPYDGKVDFIVIDMGNNLLRHGSFNDDMDWEALFLNEERDKKFDVKKSVRLCPICYTYYTNKFLLACNTCGNVFKENAMISMESLIPETLNKPLHTMTLKELQIYGKLKGYKNGWAWLQRFPTGGNRQKYNQSELKIG